MRTNSRLLILPALLWLSACASDTDLDGPSFEAPDTAVSYEIVLTGLPNEEMQELATESLAIYRQQERGAQSLAFLKRRAKGDEALLQKLLRSRGYYKGEISIEVTRDETESDQDGTRATVTLTVDPGPAFTLARHDFLIDDPSGRAPQLTPAGLGSPVGAPAQAEAIVNAETAAVDRLERTGFPYARKGRRRAVADIEAATLEIDSPLATGPASVFGTLIFGGLEDVEEAYLRTYLPWIEGETFNLSLLRSYQRALLGTDLFDSVTVKPPASPPDGAGPVPVPVTVEATERPFRTVSAGARFSTDEGPSVTGGFEHRNLWGANETLTVEAEIGIPMQSFGVGYREPQYLRPSQDLTASLVIEREEDDAFDSLTTTATLGLQRRLSEGWVVGAGGLVEASLISDSGRDQPAYLLGIPLFASYDGSDDLLNPTEGARTRIALTPYAGLFDGDLAGFVSIDATGSAYYDITGEKDYVLAGRARLGSVLAEDRDKVPQTRRLYSGGGGSVRGYAQRIIGPLDQRNDPEGGLSAAELGAEFRGKIFGDFGGTLFVEAGSVSEQSFPDFDDGVQMAAGLGFRYFSPAGPIRVDFAFPLNPRDADDAFQFYFSIGQAF